MRFNATTSEIGVQYRAMVKRWHLDVCPAPEATEKMKDINAAWTILKDTASRNEWDKEYGWYAMLQSITMEYSAESTITYESPTDTRQESPTPAHSEPTGSEKTKTTPKPRKEDKFWYTYTGDPETCWQQHCAEVEKEAQEWQVQKTKWEKGEIWWGWWSDVGVRQYQRINECRRRLREDWDKIQRMKKTI